MLEFRSHTNDNICFENDEFQINIMPTHERHPIQELMRYMNEMGNNKAT